MGYVLAYVLGGVINADVLDREQRNSFLCTAFSPQHHLEITHLQSRSRANQHSTCSEAGNLEVMLMSSWSV